MFGGDDAEVDEITPVVTLDIVQIDDITDFDAKVDDITSMVTVDNAEVY